MPESKMAHDIAPTSDAAADMKTATETERARVSAIMAAFADDVKYAADCINSGIGVMEAKANYLDVVREKQKSLASIAPAKAVQSDEPVNTGQGFLAACKRMALERGISLSKAADEVARIDRAAYLAYIGVPED